MVCLVEFFFHFPLLNDNYFIVIVTNSLISEPFEPSPFMPSVNQAFEEDFSVPANQQERQEQDAEPSSPFPKSEKESSGRENSVAKIRVVVWHFFRSCYLVSHCLVVIQAMVVITGELYIFTYLFR